MLKRICSIARGAAVVIAATGMLSVSAMAADNSFAAKPVNYNAVEERGVGAYFQTSDVDSNAEKSVVSVETEEIPYATVTKESDELLKGDTQVVQKGVNGTKKITTTTKYVNGEAADVTIEEETVEQPVDEIVAVGTKSNESSVPGTDMEYAYAMTMNATAYCPCSRCCGKWANGVTASGLKAGYGVCAVDTRVIPLGTKLYVEGYGYCIAADTGGAIKGNRIDLCYGSHSAALNSGFGHKSVKVYVLK